MKNEVTAAKEAEVRKHSQFLDLCSHVLKPKILKHRQTLNPMFFSFASSLFFFLSVLLLLAGFLGHEASAQEASSNAQALEQRSFRIACCEDVALQRSETPLFNFEKKKNNN